MRVSLRILFCLLVVLIAGASLAQPVVLTATMNGANERPVLGDPDGVGYAVVTLDPVANTVNFALVVQGIAAPNAAHIHRGLPDVAGPVVVNFNPTFANGFATGTVNATPALIAEISANPGAFYVNVHNADFPGGAVRGTLTGPSSSAVTLTALLNGANERPTPGDPDGSGFAVVRFERNTNTIRWAIITQNIGAPNAAHIHRGTADVAGGVVVNFNPTFIGGIASGTVTADAALITEILGNPAGFYVNVHNAEFPGGAIRGQLTGVAVGATDLVFPVVGRAAGANGTFYRTDLSLLNVSGGETPVVLEYFRSGGSGPATATTTLILAPGEQRNINGDALQALLGVGDGTGALRVVATRSITGIARIYNDERPIGGGTFSQFVAGQPNDASRTSGALPMLANQQAASGAGYRTNIGWFNGSSAAAGVTFRAHRANGVVIQTVTRNVAAGEQLQVPLHQLFPDLEPLDALYVTFTTAGAPLYVYASVVDNVNGDAIFIPAQPR